MRCRWDVAIPLWCRAAPTWRKARQRRCKEAERHSFGSCNARLGVSSSSANQPGTNDGTRGETVNGEEGIVLRGPTAADNWEPLRRQYGGTLELTGAEDALYERHLLFDNVAVPATAGMRERYEAFARSVRDVLSQRWVRTE